MKKSVLEKIQNSLLPTYKNLITEKQNNILKQCYDFSSLSSHSKLKIQDLLFSINIQQNPRVQDLNDILLDSFTILKTRFEAQKFQAVNKFQINDRNRFNKELKVTNNDKAYLFSIKQARELLYLCSQYYINKNTSLLDMLNVSVKLEDVNLYNKSVNSSNIHQIVNSLSVDYICIDLKS